MRPRRGRFVDIQTGAPQSSTRGVGGSAEALRARFPLLRPELVPFVEVTLVRAPAAVGPVVEVALEPVEVTKCSLLNSDGAK